MIFFQRNKNIVPRVLPTTVSNRSWKRLCQATEEHALLNQIEIMTTEEEESLLLEELSSHNQFVATLLPIRTVGVKGDCRIYSYRVALSSDQTQPNWKDLATYPL
ncbi:hypothetical protein OUZ56_015936 [Daphnia magna]|uniref:GMP synthase n=1 Tax=Daphnia magna TaxID=35525 RepID=A0ABR0AP67_9CRUS|nr:hypothetical protein OUZ56_015936 [Daphnia magna]